MKSILDEIRNSTDCIVLPPCGLPQINDEHALPKDLEEFYKECGGVSFFIGSDYAMEIVSPDKLVLSNPVILADGWEVDVPEDDISNDWYIVAEAGPEQRISIDLHKNRFGKCYDSFWDIHASPGECPVLALSFSELLEKIFACKGGYWFWLADDFIYLGDAYD
ncbi:SMI1/KNR4 family protein [Photobacterium sp. 2_MG-2023]|uniref:SMI1/KNR4 family protein n=1 Tax=Photobacterium sp. 2_MG-2023 TaxID=3062663 RepID=UPI0026E40A2B|nr:SMI1/KNR4 family protein [Photobacterium sp. 2_MG-2023]MDO6580636.1 SMI1/KNR4 family protein [Photobacterium sp. 2_MG-2023]